MKQLLLSLIFLSASNTLFGGSYHVGANQDYPSPNALYQANVLDDGDSIFIEAAIYEGEDALANWSKSNLYIKGINGRPHLKAAGAYILGKGIWVCSGNDITVENIEFSGAIVPDKNGAGIRLDGIGLTVSHCHFHDNENGILTSSPFEGTVLIEYSEFNDNGYGDGFSHNIYINHVEFLIFRYNYSHHAKIGHCIKSRAANNFILYNRIMDEASGNSSRLIDISNGGRSLIMGNYLMQGPNAENNNLIGYGLEGLENSSEHDLYIVNNTMVNERQASCVFMEIALGTSSAHLYNNLMAGSCLLSNGEITNASGNYAQNGINLLFFEDPQNYNYKLKEESPAIDFGTIIGEIDGLDLNPNWEYEHPMMRKGRTVISGKIDPGANEYKSPLSVMENAERELKIYPNPFQDELNFEDSLLGAELCIYNLMGEKVHAQKISETKISLKQLVAGTYYVQINQEGTLASKLMIKHLP